MQDNNQRDANDAENEDLHEQVCQDAAELLNRLHEQQELQAQQQQNNQLPQNRLDALLQQSKIHSPLLTIPRSETQQDELSINISRALRGQIKAAKPEQFYKIQQSAEYGVKPTFHLLTPLNLEDDTKKEQIFKDVYNISNRLNLFKKACHKYDMDNVFTVPI